MVSAHPQTIDITRQPPKLGDFFSPYHHQQQQQQPSIIQQQQFDNNSSSNNNYNIFNGYENTNIFQQHQQNHGNLHRPNSVTSLPLRQQNQININNCNNNALTRQSQQNNRRSPLLSNNQQQQQQFGSPLGGQPQPLMSSPDGFQESQQMLQNRSNSQNSIPKNPKLYKTELCRSWMDHGRCNYGERCQYAHGEPEKRPIPRHPKYKTEACSSYHKTGYCPYGPRCHFIHNEEPAVLRQLIAQNALATGIGGGSEQTSPVQTPGLMPPSRPRNLSLQQTMSAPPSTVATPQHPQHQQQQCQRQYSNILPIGSRPSPQQQQQFFVQKQLGSDGESPIPSSTTDSGSESPLGSFSPGLEESLCRLSPTSFRRSLSQTTARWSPTTTNNSGAAVVGNNKSSIGMIFSTNNGSNDPWNESPLINSLSSLSFGEGNNNSNDSSNSSNPWEIKSSPVAAARLPVFERLSNNL
jgi:butyrate response factor 1